jgi:lipoprotein NlpI
LRLKDYAGAIEDFDEILIFFPKFAKAYSNRGIAKYYLNDKQGALEDFNKAGELGYTTAYELIKKYKLGK